MFDGVGDEALFQRLLSRLELEHDARKALRERVVDLPRHPVTLVEHGQATSSVSDMTSRNGSITVELTGTPDVRLDLKTDGGRARSELATATSFSSGRELRGVVGDGSSLLRARTGNGDITVR